MLVTLEYVCRRLGGNRKKRVKSDSGKGGRARDIYGTMFKSKGILPNDLARQDPKLLFTVLNQLEDEETEEIPPEFGFFYGM